MRRAQNRSFRKNLRVLSIMRRSASISSRATGGAETTGDGRVISDPAVECWLLTGRGPASASLSAASPLPERRCGPPVPDDISATSALNFGRLAEGSGCKAFSKVEPIQHPVDRVARYTQQLGRAMAITLGRLQCTDQREFRCFADYGIERVGPILRGRYCAGLS